MSKHFYYFLLMSLMLSGLTLIMLSGDQTAQADVNTIIIDDFSVDQAVLFTLITNPDTAEVVTTTSSILGDERDVFVSSAGASFASVSAVSGQHNFSVNAATFGTNILTWDGPDASPALDPTGLGVGGLDLTNSGSNDAFLVGFNHADLNTTLVITVYTDATNFSSFSSSLPTVMSATDFHFAYSDFTAAGGTGADFSNVGAIQMHLSGNSVDVVMDTLETTSLADIVKTDTTFDVDGSGTVSPGDIITYAVVITNLTDVAAITLTNAIFASNAPTNTTLNVGLVTVSCAGGTDTSSVTTGNTGGDTSVAVSLDEVSAGEVCTVIFSVTIDNPLPLGVTTITSQGGLNYDERDVPLPTDAGNTGAIGDPNITPVGQTLDWGDNPDSSYNTLSASGGPRHLLIPAGPYMGLCVDAEADGQPTAGADGDDLGVGTSTTGACATANDDEDGVTFTTGLYPGITTNVDIVVTNAVCTLDGWIDFNADGDFADPGEQIFTNTNMTVSTNALTFTVPAAATLGSTFSRFRCSTDTNLPADGGVTATDGEVEDHPVTISTPSTDWGDNPDSYGTTSGASGPNHTIGGPYLGACVDDEANGIPTAGSDGDDLDTGTSTLGTCAVAGDDEDGITFLAPLVPGTTNTTDVIVDVNAAAACLLNAWIDFNGDGDFLDAGEQIATDLSLGAGSSTALTISVPLTAIAGGTYSRFRCNTAGGLTPTGPALDGEVEDHPLVITATNVDFSKIIIDDFSVDQAVLFTLITNPDTAEVITTTSSILSGERDIFVSSAGGTFASVSAVSGQHNFSVSAATFGTNILTWDGWDGHPMLDPTGLGGIDLTNSGINDAFLVDLNHADLNTTLVITIYTDATNFSSFSSSLPTVMNATDFHFAYSDFTAAGGTGADFSNVGAIQLHLSGFEIDVIVDTFETTSLAATASPQLHLNKIGPSSVLAGQPINYTLSLFNSGLMTATNIVITDVMPLKALYHSGGTLNNDVVNWTVPTLAPAELVTMMFAVTATQDISNTTYTAIAAGGYTASGTNIISTTVLPFTGIAGSVTAAVTGQPLPQIYVAIYYKPTGPWRWYDGGQTDINGHYQFEAVPTGTYYVCFYDWLQQRYLSACYQDADDLDSSTAVNVPLSGPLNMALSSGGHLSGTVTTPNGSPIAGIYLQVRRWVNNRWSWAGWAKTDEQGRYDVSRLKTGTYRIAAFDYNWHNRIYAPKYYQNGTDWDSADDVAVIINQTTPNINIQLDEPGGITGTVSDDKSGLGLSDIIIYVDRREGSTWNWASSGSTDAAGNYSLAALRPGSYRLYAVDRRWPLLYQKTYYLNQVSIETATPITVTTGLTTSAVNLSMSPFGRITGTVVYANGNPVPDVWVRVYRQNNNNWIEVNRWWATRTDAKGNYTVADLRDATYRLGFFSSNGSITYEYYNKANTLGNGQDLVVTQGQTTANINAQLPSPIPPLALVSPPSGNHGSYVNMDPLTGQFVIGQSHVDRYQSPVTITVRGEITGPPNTPANTTVVKCFPRTAAHVTLTLVEANGTIIYSDNNPTFSAPNYTWVIDEAQINSMSFGVYRVIITWDCVDDNGTIILSHSKKIGTFQLYDPSGYITDAVTGHGIQDAVVELYKVPYWLPKQSVGDTTPNTCQSHLSKAEDDLWDQPAPTHLGLLADPDAGEIDPATNPLLTDQVGHYAWDVAEGCWYIKVTATGYQTQVSPLVGIPPEVTDLHLELVPYPALQFDNVSYQVNELAGMATLTVSSVVPVTQTATVAYSSQNNTALAGTDYSAVTGTLTFNVGDSHKTITLPIIDNQVEEFDRTMFVTLNNPLNISLRSRTIAVLTIVDDEGSKSEPSIYLPFILKDVTN